MALPQSPDSRALPQSPGARIASLPTAVVLDVGAAEEAVAHSVGFFQDDLDDDFDVLPHSATGPSNDFEVLEVTAVVVEDTQPLYS